jgi:hypothetical protein
MQRIACHTRQSVHEPLGELGDGSLRGADPMLPLAGDTSGTQLEENSGNFPCFPIHSNNGLKWQFFKGNQSWE